MMPGRHTVGLDPVFAENLEKFAQTFRNVAVVIVLSQELMGIDETTIIFTLSLVFGGAMQPV